MFNKLKQKWGVGPMQLILILCTFAIGGSLSGYLGKFALSQLPISSQGLNIIVYIVLVTLFWPVSVILVSIPFGQFQFFKSYLKKMYNRITGNKAGIILLFGLYLI